jgi:hypothetical protein
VQRSRVLSARVYSNLAKTTIEVPLELATHLRSNVPVPSVPNIHDTMLAVELNQADSLASILGD